MTVADKLPQTTVQRKTGAGAGTVPVRPALFGLRFAVTPKVPCDKHKKTYYTVTVKEATQVSRDGKVEVVQDQVQQERED